MTDKPLHYADLVKRYGKDMAYDLLLTIEKLAKTQNNADATLSEEDRLQRALDTIDRTNFGVEPPCAQARHEAKAIEG